MRVLLTFILCLFASGLSAQVVSRNELRNTNNSIRADMAAADTTTSNGVISQISATILSSNANRVVGPASATDTAIARYNGTTGKLVKDSGILVTDSDELVFGGGQIFIKWNDPFFEIYDGAAYFHFGNNELHVGANMGALSMTVTNFMQIPVGAAPTTDAFGEIAGDNNAWAASRGAVQHFDGTANTYLIGVLVSDAPSNGQVPKWNTDGTITWEDDGGGSGTPGGSDTQVQFNDGGSFGGDAEFTFDKTGNALSLSNGTLNIHDTEVVLGALGTNWTIGIGGSNAITFTSPAGPVVTFHTNGNVTLEGGLTATSFTTDHLTVLSNVTEFAASANHQIDGNSTQYYVGTNSLAQATALSYTNFYNTSNYQFHVFLEGAASGGSNYEVTNVIGGALDSIPTLFRLHGTNVIGSPILTVTNGTTLELDALVRRSRGTNFIEIIYAWGTR
jgi:hypothetical protein